jgi:prophage maintenance system killer protein
MNGLRLQMTNDEAYDLVVSIVTNERDGVQVTARVLQSAGRRCRL